MKKILYRQNTSTKKIYIGYRLKRYIIIFDLKLIKGKFSASGYNIFKINLLEILDLFKNNKFSNRHYYDWANFGSLNLSDFNKMLNKVTNFANRNILKRS